MAIKLIATDDIAKLDRQIKITKGVKNMDKQIKLKLETNSNNETLEDLKKEISYLTKSLKGKQLREVLKMTQSDLKNKL